MTDPGFRAIFQEYKSYVYTIIWSSIRTVGTPEDAEECVSDVFAEVFARLDKINEGSLKAYIGTVARRTAVHRYRSLSRENAAPEDDLSELPDTFDLEAEYDRSETYRAMLDKVIALGEPDMTIIIQKYFYDLSSREIARNTGLSPVAVRVRLKRALKRLRDHINE